MFSSKEKKTEESDYEAGGTRQLARVGPECLWVLCEECEWFQNPAEVFRSQGTAGSSAMQPVGIAVGNVGVSQDKLLRDSSPQYENSLWLRFIHLLTVRWSPTRPSYGAVDCQSYRNVDSDIL